MLLFIASGTTAAGVLGLFTFGATVLAVASAILAAVTATLHFGQRASRFAEFSVFWGRIHADYQRLWDNVEAHAVTQEVVVERLRALQERLESIDRQASTTPHPPEAPVGVLRRSDGHGDGPMIDGAAGGPPEARESAASTGSDTTTLTRHIPPLPKPPPPPPPPSPRLPAHPTPSRESGDGSMTDRQSALAASRRACASPGAAPSAASRSG